MCAAVRCSRGSCQGRRTTLHASRPTAQAAVCTHGTAPDHKRGVEGAWSDSPCMPCNRVSILATPSPWPTDATLATGRAADLARPGRCNHADFPGLVSAQHIPGEHILSKGTWSTKVCLAWRHVQNRSSTPPPKSAMRPMLKSMTCRERHPLMPLTHSHSHSPDPAQLTSPRQPRTRLTAPPTSKPDGVKYCRNSSIYKVKARLLLNDPGYD